jgi:hypothetical protein
MRFYHFHNVEIRRFSADFFFLCGFLVALTALGVWRYASRAAIAPSASKLAAPFSLNENRVKHQKKERATSPFDFLLKKESPADRRGFSFRCLRTRW